jgi:hypothetical protein
LALRQSVDFLEQLMSVVLFSRSVGPRGRTTTYQQIGAIHKRDTYTIFYLKGIAPEEVTLSHIYQGVIPFLLLMLLAVLIFSLFPSIIMFAPRAAGLV